MEKGQIEKYSPPQISFLKKIFGFYDAASFHGSSLLNSRDHPGTAYYLLEYAVNIHNSIKMAELHFDSTPPSLYKFKFSLGIINMTFVLSCISIILVKSMIVSHTLYVHNIPKI